MIVNVYDKFGHDMSFEVDPDDISFIDNESHGKASTFGVTSTFTGRKLIICSPNVVAVEVVA